MAAVATGSVNMVDVQDGQPIACMISSSLPRIQIKDLNAGTFSPDWTSTFVILTPVITYAGQPMNRLDSSLSYVVKRKEPTAAEADLLASEYWDASNKWLRVSSNVLDAVAGGALTYIFHVTHTDPVTLVATTVDASIDFALVWTGTDGTNGDPGAPGVDAVRMTLYAPDGDVFQNQAGQLTLQASAYVGTTALDATTADFAWDKYSGVWTEIVGETGTSLIVDGSEVVGLQAYQCRMRYPKTTGAWYNDVYTLTDKTDSYQAAIESTGGNTFRNGVGTAAMTCRLWQNGVEVDPVKTTEMGQALPTTGLVTGRFYYLLDPTSPRVKLYRYSGSAWVDVTSDAYRHTKTYTWYRRDKDGAAMDGGAAFTATSLTDPKAVGKIIYIDGDDVTQKTTFTCEVT